MLWAPRLLKPLSEAVWEGSFVHLQKSEGGPERRARLGLGGKSLSSGSSNRIQCDSKHFKSIKIIKKQILKSATQGVQ